MGPESWVPTRDCFMFRRDSLAGRWIFLVDRATLADLAGSSRHDSPAVIFARYRSLIYQAALRRMETGSPAEQQVLTADEIRSAELDFGDTLVR